MPKPKIVAAVTHQDEITLDLCLESLEKQTVCVEQITVVSGVSSESDALNLLFEFGLEAGADIVVHASADKLLDEKAVSGLVSRMDLETTYLVSARGFDVFRGRGTPVEVRAFNLNLLGDRFKFKDTPEVVLAFCEDVEEKQATPSVRRNLPG